MAKWSTEGAKECIECDTAEPVVPLRWPRIAWGEAQDCCEGGSVLKCSHGIPQQARDFRGTIRIAATNSFRGRTADAAAFGGTCEPRGSQPRGRGCAHRAGR